MKAFLLFKSHTRVWSHAVAVGNSIILLLSHVLEENFFLLCFFLLWLFSHPLHFLPCFSVLILSKPLAQPHGLYLLYFHHPFTFTIPWPSSWWHHCFSSRMSLSPSCPPLSCPFSMFPMPSAAPPLHISGWGSPPCLPNTSLTSAHLALHPLHTRFSSDPSGGLPTSWCSRQPSLLKAVQVWWHDEIQDRLYIKFTQIVAYSGP